MIKGYKYYFYSDGENCPDVSIDHSLETFKSTMEYEDLELKNSQDFAERFSGVGNLECHKALVEILDKNKLIVGLGSGYGEHEFLLHQKGYNIIASDVIHDLGKSLKKIDRHFRHLAIDVLKDDIRLVLENKLGVKDQYFDLLVSGMDVYFDDAQLEQIFLNIYKAMQRDSKLIWVLSYRNYLLAKMIELLIKIEAKFIAFKTGRKCAQKEHGFRRSHGEILRIAYKCGYQYEKKKSIFLGYEIYRSIILTKLGFFKLARLTDKLLPFFNSRTVFVFTKKE